MHEVQSPVAGNVWKIVVSVGDTISEGDEIMILESMKMEIPVEAEASGIVESLEVAEGDSVSEDDCLAKLGG